MDEDWKDYLWDEPEDSDVEPEVEEPSCRSTYDISTRGSGERPIRVDAWTNDNLDAGYPSEDASWTTHWRTLADALRITGYTRYGFYGHRVEVRVNGTLVHHQAEAEAAARGGET